MLQYFRAALYCYYSSWILYPSQFLVFLKPTDISTVVKIKSIHACCKIVKSKHSSHSHFLVLVQYSLFYCPQINYRPRQRIKGFHSSQLGMWIIFHSTNICHFTRTNFCNSIRFMKIPFTTLCIWYTGTYLSFNIICSTCSICGWTAAEWWVHPHMKRASLLVIVSWYLTATLYIPDKNLFCVDISVHYCLWMLTVKLRHD